MDGHALDVLELAAVRERLANHTSFSAGRALAEALLPSPDAGEVAARQALCAEAMRLVEHGPPRMSGAHDVREDAEHAGRGGALGAEGLVAIAETARAALGVRGHLAERADSVPLLAGEAGGIAETLAIVADVLERALELDPPGVKDSASPKLKALRSELATARRRASDRLRSLASDPDLQPHLQENFVTERGGRPVIAVRASARSAVPGIVHDTSNSGQTLFVEPFAIVELSNRLRELEGDERDEVARILAELSRNVGAYASELGPRGRGAGARRPRARERRALARVARLPDRAGRRRRSDRRAPSAARSGDGRAGRPAALGRARARAERRQHGRQDRRAEDARPVRAAAPVRPPRAGGARAHAGVRRRARRHRRRAVDRGLALDVLGTPPQPRARARGGHAAHARAARRGGRRHRPDRRRRARPRAARPTLAARRADDHDDALRRGQAVGERDRGRDQRRRRLRRRDARADLHAHARATRSLPRARDRPPARARRRRDRAGARGPRTGARRDRAAPARGRSLRAGGDPASARRPRASAPRRRRCASRRRGTKRRSAPRPRRPPRRSPRSASVHAPRPRATSRRTGPSSRRCARSCAPPAARSACGARPRAPAHAPRRPSATAAWARPTSTRARPAARSTSCWIARSGRPAHSRSATRCAPARSDCAA